MGAVFLLVYVMGMAKRTYRQLSERQHGIFNVVYKLMIIYIFGTHQMWIQGGRGVMAPKR